jgi:hypothetical protein
MGCGPHAETFSNPLQRHRGFPPQPRSNANLVRLIRICFFTASCTERYAGERYAGEMPSLDFSDSSLSPMMLPLSSQESSAFA